MLGLLLIVSGGTLVCSLLQLLRTFKLKHLQFLHRLMPGGESKWVVLASWPLDDRDSLTSFPCI